MPPFPDDMPVIVFDGVCALCSGFVRFVAARDRAGQFRFIAAQSALGQALFRHYGLDPMDYETNLLIADGRAVGRMEAFAGVMSRLGGACSAATVVLLLPQPARDWLYERIARNRYRLFGRYDACVKPDPSWSDRVIGG